MSLIVTVILLISITGCIKKEANPVPRRIAYPRIELYDTIYSRIINSPVNVYVNSGSETEISHRSNNDTWINVRYPRYHATLSLTLIKTSGDSLKKAINNRQERMSLNINGLPYRTFDTSDKDIVGTIPVAERPCVTPVQVLATDNSSFLLTGALVFDGDGHRDLEEIAPVVNAVKDDLMYMLDNLK